MFNKKSKLMVAGVLVACGLAAIAWKSAWATPGVGITTTIIAGPTSLGDNHVHSNSDVNAVEIKTKGDSDCYVVLNRIAPGGHTGWHSHPGLAVITLQAGQVTLYSEPVGGGKCRAHTYSAGQVFLERPHEEENVVNTGDVPAVAGATFFNVPHGGSTFIDRPDPGDCPG